MAISHCYSQIAVKNGNFTLLLTSSSQEWQLTHGEECKCTLLLTSSGQEWQYIATDI